MFSSLFVETIVHIYIYIQLYRCSYIVIRNSWAKHGSASFRPILIFMTPVFFHPFPTPSISSVLSVFLFVHNNHVNPAKRTTIFHAQSVFTGNVARDVRRHRGSCLIVVLVLKFSCTIQPMAEMFSTSSSKIVYIIYTNMQICTCINFLLSYKTEYIISCREN